MRCPTPHTFHAASGARVEALGTGAGLGAAEGFGAGAASMRPALAA